MNKLIISILIGLLFVCGVQIGIYKGRLLEKEKSAETINENANLKKELLKYEKAINGKMANIALKGQEKVNKYSLNKAPVNILKMEV